VKTSRAESTGEQKRSYALILFAVVIVIIIAFSAHVRLEQYDLWKESPDRYFAESKPLLTTSDAYYWIRLAQEYRDGEYNSGESDRLRAYPDGAKRVWPVPLLSLMLATASAIFGVELYETGIYLIPLLAGLFMIPLGLYCWRIGLPAAAILGGLITLFCREYFTRTSIGRVDTDALNLFFPFLASLLVLCAAESGSRKRTLLFSTLAGLSMFFFYWWYYHAGFSIVYLGLLILCLILGKRGWRTILEAAALYAVASNPVWLWKGCAGIAAFVRNTLFGSRADAISESVNLPAVLHTVTEFQLEPLVETLELILSWPLVVVVGLILFLPAAITRWRKLLPLLPLLGLGLLSFTSGRRFTIYLAPFVGIGYGWLLTVILDRLLGKLRKAAELKQVAACGAALLLFVPLYGATAAKFVPEPSLSSRTISTFARLNETLPPGAVVVSWWDYGYAMSGVGGLTTYHDGSSHRINTYLIARALTATSQQELYGTTAFINETGEEGLLEMLEESPAPAALLDGVGSYEGGVGRDDVHVLYLAAMIQKYAAIHYLGNWDLKSGSGKAEGYQRLQCSDWSGDRIRCGEMTIDAKTGYIREGLALEKIVLIRDGYEFQEMVFPNDTDVYLQVLLNGDSVFGFFLLNDRVYRSNFNQMFFLGRYDRSLFEEVYKDFPTARVFKMRGVRAPFTPYRRDKE
jgi:undecaprenyl-diphosphooligosaccharide--protein glycosyltransferase